MIRRSFLKRMALAAAACAFIDVPWPKQETARASVSDVTFAAAGHGAFTITHAVVYDEAGALAVTALDEDGRATWDFIEPATITHVEFTDDDGELVVRQPVLGGYVRVGAGDSVSVGPLVFTDV